MTEETERRGWILVSEYLPTVHPPTSNEEIDQRCILCFDSLHQESCVILKCTHSFHLGCWLKVVDKTKCCLCTLATDTSASQVNAGISVSTDHNVPLRFAQNPYVTNMGTWAINMDVDDVFIVDEERKTISTEEDTEG